MNPVKRTFGISLLIALVSGAFAVAGPAAAVAKVPRATLTHTEYRLLGKTLVGIKQAVFGKSLDLTLGYASCRADGSSSPLMRSERSACGNEVALFEQLEQVEVTEIRCHARYLTATTTTTPTPTTTSTVTTGTTTATGTTTTGTTTTGTTTTAPTTTTTVDGYNIVQLQLVACLSPSYQRVTHDIQTVYAASALNHMRAVARGFTGTCLATLAGPAKLIADERRFAGAGKEIAADFALLSELADGQSPKHVILDAQLTSDGLAFELAATAYTADMTPIEKLASCAHE
jgi:hypothetical protein